MQCTWTHRHNRYFETLSTVLNIIYIVLRLFMPEVIKLQLLIICECAGCTLWKIWAVAFCEVFVGGGRVLAARPDCITKANTRPYCHSAARRASGYLLRLTLVHFSSKHISHILLKQGFYISLDFQTESLVGASNLGYILFARQLQKKLGGFPDWCPPPPSRWPAGQLAPFVGALERQREDLGDTRHWRTDWAAPSPKLPFYNWKLQDSATKTRMERRWSATECKAFLVHCRRGWGLNNHVFAKVLVNPPPLVQKLLLAAGLPFRHVPPISYHILLSQVFLPAVEDFLLEYIVKKCWSLEV